MIDRPIIFSGPMVRAILAGTKTQTRRVVGPLSKRFPLINLRDHDEVFSGLFADPFSWGYAHAEDGYSGHMSLGMFTNELSPYGVAGDRLWVRETHAGDSGCGWVYRADHPHADIRAGDLDDGEQQLRRWIPSIHMPRRLSRILLEVTRVRAERLHSISEEDAKAEGIERIGQDYEKRYGQPFPNDGPNKYTVDLGGNMSFNQPTAAGCFRGLWEVINGEASWAANPWVWIIEFKRVT